MDEPKKNPLDFFNDAVKKAEKQQRIEGFKAFRESYLEMREAGFTTEEVMAFFAAMLKNNQQQGEDEE